MMIIYSVLDYIIEIVCTRYNSFCTGLHFFQKKRIFRYIFITLILGFSTIVENCEKKLKQFCSNFCLKMCNDLDMKAIEIIFNALIAQGYSQKESEIIIARFLEEEAENYLESLEPEA